MRPVCEFNAIVCVGTSVMSSRTLPFLRRLYPGMSPGALHEEESPVGELSFCTISAGTGSNRALILVEGVLTIGKAMSPPVIRAVKRKGAALAGTLSSENARDVLTIMDSPPGTSCPMTTTVSDADVVILVTEPTPFGLHDLDLAVQTVRKMKLPFGVVINRSDSGDDRVREYCKRNPFRFFWKFRKTAASPKDIPPEYRSYRQRRNIGSNLPVSRGMPRILPEW